MAELADLHNPKYNKLVAEAHDFATKKLGIKTSRPDQVTIVDPRNIQLAKQRTGKGPTIGGGYQQSTGDIVVYATQDPANPNAAEVKNGSTLVHELTHAGSYNDNYHSYYNEALAGLGEKAYLDWLRNQGRWQRAGAFILQRADVELAIPGQFRYYDPSEPRANTSQGLIAATGVQLGLQSSGIKAGQVVGMSSLGGHEQFAAMQYSLDSIQPGLSREVERFPETTDGIIQASSTVHGAAARRGITFI